MTTQHAHILLGEAIIHIMREPRRHLFHKCVDNADLAMGHLDRGNNGEAVRMAEQCITNGGARYLIPFKREVERVAGGRSE